MKRAGPLVELLWWSGCPSWERAVEIVREEMVALEMDPEALDVREIDSEATAERERFPGSPTVRIDGRDLQPPGENPIGLTCRVYRHRDGRTSPLPDAVEVREALAAAMKGEGDER